MTSLLAKIETAASGDVPFQRIDYAASDLGFG